MWIFIYIFIYYIEFYIYISYYVIELWALYSKNWLINTFDIARWIVDKEWNINRVAWYLVVGGTL